MPRRAFLAANDNVQQAKATTSAGDQCYTPIFFIMAILRAESLWEIPVLGRLLAAGAEKRMVAAKRDTDEFVASIVPWDEDGVRAADAGPGSDPVRDPLTS